MSKKFIPNGDLDFDTMARCFAGTIAKDTARYHVSADDGEALSAAVERFGAALQASRFGERSVTATRAKDESRAQTEQIIRRLANAIRGNPKINATAKFDLGLRVRSAKAKQLPCPQEPPRLQFVRALHEGGGATPVHELSFSAMERSHSKPAGAVRLELFVDLVPPEENIPAHPAANLGSRPWYLRSYTRSPIRLVPPMARVPMRVVYWARWADSSGAVGPFSATATAWIEGGSHHLALPALGSTKPIRLIEDAAAPAGRSETYRVAVLQVQYESLAPQVVDPPRLPGPAAREQAMLESSKEAAA